MRWGPILAAGAAALFLGGTAVLAGPAPPPASAGPEAYVRWVYGRYTPDSQFDSEVAYTPGLRALFRLNSRLLGPDEVGENNDSDEICQCQDWDKLHIESLTLTPEGPGQAAARVGFANAGAHEAVTLKLLLTSSGWRVDDVIHPRAGSNASLRARLTDENRRLSRARTSRP